MKNQSQIHIHINQLIGEAHFPSKEDANDFMQRLFEVIQRVNTVTHSVTDTGASQAHQDTINK